MELFRRLIQIWLESSPRKQAMLGIWHNLTIQDEDPLGGRSLTTKINQKFDVAVIGAGNIGISRPYRLHRLMENLGRCAASAWGIHIGFRDFFFYTTLVSMEANYDNPFMAFRSGGQR